MKHRLLKAAAAVVFTCAAFHVQAANPFTDVDTNSWAYQAVSKLSAENVVEGYPDGTFRGEKNISRYEVAQIIARLVARKDSLTADQQATVDKLAQSYRDDLANLGVRVTELEKKTGHTELITELRIQDVDRYGNIFKGHTEKDNELSARVRLNTITTVNDRSTVYGQLETFLGFSGNDVYSVNKYSYNSDGSRYQNNGYGEGEVHLNRLWTTYQFGPKQDTTGLPFGPSKNLIGIGQFPVKMGVTGYTYDGEFKGAFLTLGDYREGGHFTLAYGRATNINVDYTAPMMHGFGISNSTVASLVGKLASAQAYSQALAAGYSDAQAKAVAASTETNTIEVLNGKNKGLSSDNPAIRAATAQKVKDMIVASGSDLASMADDLVVTANEQDAFTLYPMGDKVQMAWGEDEDVPIAYASYIYKKPQHYEFHIYGMRALGPVSNIAQAYGLAGQYYVTPMWNVHAEYVKNMKKLPLNNERPYSFNYGVAYGTADVLKAKSYSIGLDYIYSQAGTYFGGSTNDITDQYMGHVYSSWRGRSNVPAYFADKMDAVLDGTDNPNRNYGGAKFFLAKAAYVPMKGLIIEANYGFNAQDMGGKKMDNMFLLKATAYIK
ncbi:MAG TPA: S-layer homology domain-containing protein [Veillonellaceae bacterium]|nr:S-layer homology domain-containing protein [Veillonellaceae bacterium]